MNILLIHQHFNTPTSGGPIRSWYLATALARKGHHVVVITGSSGPSRTEASVDGVRVIYLPIPYNNRFSFNARAWTFTRFAWSASRAASRFKHFDICYAISVPLTVGLCAMYLKWRYGMPYWFEVGDLWPDAPIELGYLRNPFVKWATLSMERSIYRNAKGVVALSVPIRDAIDRKVPGLQLELIPNMADCDFYGQCSRNPAVAARFESKDKFVISYLGALGMANGVDHIIRCAETSQRAKLAVQFIVCGDGAMLDTLRASAKDKALTNIKFQGLVDRKTICDILGITDAVFISYKPAPILETGCPNKYFDGLAAGKLVIVNFGGWIREEVEANGFGFYINPDDADFFPEAIGSYMADQAKLSNAQQHARKLAEKYSRNTVSARFVSLFESLPGS